MNRFSEALKENLFCFPVSGDEHILYAPFHGLVLSVNAAFKKTLVKAIQGDAKSLATLGTQSQTLSALCSCPPSLHQKLHPQWPKAFKPTSLTLFLTHNCTLRCRYCYCFGGQGETMPWMLAEKAIRLVSGNAATNQATSVGLSLHGGDVGACWDLFTKTVDFTRTRCRELGLEPRIGLGTNAFYSEAQASYIAENINDATVSLDGLPPIHDMYRCQPNGQPTSSEVLRTIAIFDRLGFRYSVRMTVLADTVEQLPESVEFICTHSKSKQIRAEPLYLRGRATGEHLQPPSAEPFIAKFREARAIAEQHGRILSYSGARMDTITNTFCSYNQPTFGVTPNGDITCCYEVLHLSDPLCGHFFYGHIDPATGAVRIDPRRIENIRNEAVPRKEGCQDCFCVAHCAGDCAAKTMNTPGNSGALPDRCVITRELTKDQVRAVLEKGMQTMAD